MICQAKGRGLRFCTGISRHINQLNSRSFRFSTASFASHEKENRRQELDPLDPSCVSQLPQFWPSRQPSPALQSPNANVNELEGRATPTQCTNGQCIWDLGMAGKSLIEGLYCNKTIDYCEYRPKDGSCVADEVCRSNWCKDGKCRDSAEHKPCDSPSDCTVATVSQSDHWFCHPDRKACYPRQFPIGRYCRYNEQCTRIDGVMLWYTMRGRLEM